MVSADMIQANEHAERQLRASQIPGRSINVGATERKASQFGGGALLAIGLMRGGLKGLVLAGLGGALLYRGATGHCHLYEALGGNTAEPESGPMGSVAAQHGVRVEASEVITGVEPDTVYKYWRNYSNITTFMSNIASVTDLGDGCSHWVVKLPFGMTLSYDAAIHTDKPGELIAWRSIGQGDLDTAGSVHFESAPGKRGTIVRVNQKFDPPGGKVGIALARWLGVDPRTQTRENLRRLKHILQPRGNGTA